MQQLEISFFYPLTEQTLLDLDFTSTEEWIAEWRKRQLNATAYSGSFLISNGDIGVTSWSQPGRLWHKL